MFALLPVLALACSAHSLEPPSMSLELVSFTPKVEPGALTFQYTVKNRGAAPAWLVNRLFERGVAGFEPKPSVVYTRLEGSRIVFRKTMVPVPPDMDVEVPEVPYLSEVPAGGTFTETVRVPLPVAPLDPYRTQPAGKAVAEEVQLVLGWVTAVRPETVSTVEGPALWAPHSDVSRGLAELRSAVVPLRVETAIAR